MSRRSLAGIVPSVFFVLSLAAGPAGAFQTRTPPPRPKPTARVAPSVPPRPVALPTAIDALLAPVYRPGEPGAAIVVVKQGKVVFRKGYGLANLELGVPLKPEMVFRIGSVTKQLTAAAVLLLVQQGKLSLDDEITRFLPDYPTRGKAITVDQLLTHTAGIASFTDLPDYRSRMAVEATVPEMIERFRDLPLEFAPGDRFRYSDSGYYLLGAVIEKAAGTSYEEFLGKSLFGPLGMKHTAYGHNAPLLPGRVEGYTREGRGFVNAAPIAMSQPFAAGGLVSSVDDLALWDAALYTERPLTKESKRRMFADHRLSGGATTGYGYGWSIFEYAGRPVAAHGGGINGFQGYVVRLPRDRVYVALLTNREGDEGEPAVLARKVAALALGKPIPEPVAVSLDPKALDTYVGVYRIDDRHRRVITRQGSRIFTQRDGGPRVEIFPESEASFFLKGSLARLVFVRDEMGTRVVYTDAGFRETEVRTGEVPREPEAVRLDPSLLDACSGRYELAPGFVLTISRQGDRLLSQATGQEHVEIFAQSETEFFFKAVDAQITFVKDGAGKVTGLVLHQGGRDTPAPRLGLERR